jgi:hypothetical protein
MRARHRRCTPQGPAPRIRELVSADGLAVRSRWASTPTSGSAGEHLAHRVSMRLYEAAIQAETAISHSYTVSSDEPVVCTGSVNAISRAASRLSAWIT